jgi:NAD kinase
LQIGVYQSELTTQLDLDIVIQYYKDAINELKVNHKNDLELTIFNRSDFKKIDEMKLALILCFNDTDVLDVFRFLQTTEIPLLCVELPGDHSFFSAVTLRELKWGFLQLFQNNFEYDPRIRLIVNEKYFALNDVLISTKAPGQRMRYDILINKKSLLQTPDSANQILISTPTGSTALNLNLGGSICLPGSGIFQILPIASRNRGITSYIVSDSTIIEVEIIESEYPIVFNIDNQHSLPFNSQNKGFSTIKITKADSKAIFIKFPELSEEFHQQYKLKGKQSFEDTKSLTSTAKFVLHVLKMTKNKLSTTEIMNQTNITNRKTLSNALSLLLEKGFIRRHSDLHDARKYAYSYINDI